MLGIFKQKAKGLKNRATQAGARSVRGFAAADVDRLVAAWRYDGGFTPSEVASHLETIRSRSRQMAKDSPISSGGLN